MSSYQAMPESRAAMFTVSRKWCIGTIGFAVLTFIIGVLIGLLVPERFGSQSDVLLRKLTREADPYVSSRLIADIDPKNIEKHLHYLTAEPHTAGSSGNLRTAEYVRDQWKEQGFDVRTYPYDVLLSYPEEGHINRAALVEANGTQIFQTAPAELAFFPEESHPDVLRPYNAFSHSGHVQAELVYANYGRDVDFEELVSRGVNVTGKIVIAKYGRIFRGNKVLRAQQYGAVGVILYMDPRDYTHGDLTYPDSVWLPPSGVQRGNVVMLKGDQATPGYPATWYTERLSQEDLDARLPKIPSHPIGYGDAYVLMKDMGGKEAPSEWQGGFNFTYKLGGIMTQNRSVKLSVKNILKTVTIFNIIAKIDGSTESDRVVLVGNHRDAWEFGATDPGTGTAAMLEMSRVYAEQVKKGWEPRRTVMFCSWDAEEFGLVGSYEWVEENVKWLQSQAVAYLNIDTLLTGAN